MVSVVEVSGAPSADYDDDDFDVDGVIGSNDDQRGRVINRSFWQISPFELTPSIKI